MRRSSCALIVLVVLLVVAFVLLIRARDTVAGPPSPGAVQAILDQGRTALERHDVDGILRLFTPDAVIMDRSQDQLRQVLAGAMQELGPAVLTVKTSKLEVAPAGNSAVASFDIDVNEHPSGAEIHYYHAHFRATLEKVRQVRWLGLFTTEQWKISRLDSDTSLDMPSG